MAGPTAGIRLGYTGEEAREKGNELLDSFFRGFPAVDKAIEESKKFLKQNGYVEDFYGRRRHLDEINLPDYEIKPLEDEIAFNPFLNCNKPAKKSYAQLFWELVKDMYIDMGYSGQLSNSVYERLAKLAAYPSLWKQPCITQDELQMMIDRGDSQAKYGRFLKTKQFEMGKLNGTKVLNQKMGCFSVRRQFITEKDKDGESQYVILTNEEKLRADICEYLYITMASEALLDESERTKRGVNIDPMIELPTQPILFIANTGRKAQAERQCFNARIQGCLDYNNLIYTDNGIYKIGDLVNQEIKVWDGNDWSSAVVLPSGKKQKCRLTTGLGDEFICSPDHKFLTVNTYGTEAFKKLSELKPQDRLVFEDSAPVWHKHTDVLLRQLFIQNYSSCHNKHNYSFDDIKDKYIRGQILGRIASDGSYIISDAVDNGVIYLFVAEHESELLEYFKNNLPFKYSIDVTQKKNQKIYRIAIHSLSLAKECEYLDIKHDINQYFFSDCDLLRGFISGFFDGDGTANHNNIQLDFGTQADFSNILLKFKQALNIFGIKNTIKTYKDRYRVVIRRSDSVKFAERIGFINSLKQSKAVAKTVVKDNHTFNNRTVTTIKSIEITDEFVEMYDVCNTERGYFVVNGLITHNSAATLTKLAMIDIANDQLMKDCQAKLIIPVHDELLVECPAYYADQVYERLPKLMVNAAKKGGIEIPQKCDPYCVDRWYADEMAALLLDEYAKLIKGDVKKGIQPVSKSEALETLYKDHREIPEKSILDVIEGRTPDEVVF